MITADLRFGSYEKTDSNNLFVEFRVDDDSTEARHISSCTLSNKWTPLELLRVDRYNHDVSMLTFQLPAGVDDLCLPLGAYLLVQSPEGDTRPYTSVSAAAGAEERGCFTVMVKRYDEWGSRESPETHFLFTRTDHTYRPKGKVSNYLHGLQVGDRVRFKHAGPCVGRLGGLFDVPGRCVTMICVGIGLAPMAQSIAALFRRPDVGIRVVLIYGVRRAEDVLLRDQLFNWAERRRDVFRLVICVGSRYNNVHMGAASLAKGRARDYIPPPDLLEAFCGATAAVVQGWINEDVIKEHAFPPSVDDTRVLVCGLPGVYLKICGPRSCDDVSPGSALANLGYTKQQVIKL